MSEHHFGLYRGHLTQRLVAAVEKKFPGVSVTNYTEPRGEKRGWFSGPNRGSPFDDRMAAEVLAYARSIARGADRERLSCDDAAESVQESGYGSRWGR
jgi:hypothetical protein